MAADYQTLEGPVTFVVSREISPEKEEVYRQWVNDLGEAARQVD